MELFLEEVKDFEALKEVLRLSGAVFFSQKLGFY